MQKEFRQQAADIVKRARLFSGLSQLEFAQQIGRSQTVVSKYERGGTAIPSEIVMRCMVLLGLLNGMQAPSADEVAKLVRESLNDPNLSDVRRALAELVKSIT